MLHVNVKAPFLSISLPPVSMLCSWQGITEVDEDGFLMGELDGKTGYVPSNLVEEVTDNEELNEIRSILREKGTLRRDTQDLNGSGVLREGEGGDGVVRVMVAEYDYNPGEDSPNENSEVELPLIEGQRVTVFGWADEDGFVKVCKSEVNVSIKRYFGVRMHILALNKKNVLRKGREKGGKNTCHSGSG